MRPLSVAAFAVATLCLTVMSGSADSTVGSGSSQTWLQQGWTAQQRDDWYTRSQGSRLIPLSWFQALEQPDGAGMFLDDAYIASFRYVPSGNGALPIGFAVDTQDDGNLSVSRLRWRAGQGNQEPWVGFNCAACHTAEITYRGTALRVEGGPTMADFQGFFEAFNLALTRTRDDPARFARFAVRVLGAADNPGNRNRLSRALSDLTAYQLRIAAMDHTNLRYGFGRVDAIGNIYNKVAYVAAPDNPTTNEPDAPVSYPFLWNVPQHERVQWNGIVHNIPIQYNGQTIDVGALGRNAGEAIGVFSDVQPQGFLQFGARSSVQANNLIALERQLMSLSPPRWPSEVFGAPNPTLVREGRDLYESQGCPTCHIPLQRADLTTRSIDRMTPLTDSNFDRSTDIWMVCNTMMAQARTGRLQGQRPLIVAGNALRDVEPVSAMLGVLVVQTIAARAPTLLNSGVANFQGSVPRTDITSDKSDEIAITAAIQSNLSAAPASAGVAEMASVDPREARRLACRNALGNPTIAPNLGYKARPLNGVWATAPYLHDGSVASLYELLLPPDRRTPSFYTGSREFDPVHVGFVTAQGPDNTFEFRARDASGVAIDGNSNGGHDYGVGALTDDQRMAIVEYLKVIGEPPPSSP